MEDIKVIEEVIENADILTGIGEECVVCPKELALLILTKLKSLGWVKAEDVQLKWADKKGVSFIF